METTKYQGKAFISKVCRVLLDSFNENLFNEGHANTHFLVMFDPHGVQNKEFFSRPINPYNSRNSKISIEVSHISSDLLYTLSLQIHLRLRSKKLLIIY